MAMLDFDTARYCNLVAHKQQNVYTNARVVQKKTFFSNLTHQPRKLLGG